MQCLPNELPHSPRGQRVRRLESLGPARQKADKTIASKLKVPVPDRNGSSVQGATQRIATHGRLLGANSQNPQFRSARVGGRFPGSGLAGLRDHGYRTARPNIRPVSLYLAVQGSILKTVKPARCSLLYRLAEHFLVVYLCRGMLTPRCCLDLTMKPKKLKHNGNNGSFDPQVFLDTAGVSRKVVEYRRNESIYAQGDAAETVMYIQKGGVKFSVVNGSGKEAVVAMFGPTDFFGEGCMAGQSLRMGSTTAVTPTTLLVMQKEELLRVLHAEHELSDHFIAYMLAHNIRVEEDLIDQLFNSSEKRLARTLLLLARYGQKEQPDSVLPKVSQETLASMVGTTRSRVNFFMNKFRKLGFIEYNGKIKVNKSLLTVVLHE